MKRILSISAVFLFAIMLMSCSDDGAKLKATEELKKAQQSLQQAEQNGVKKYAPQEYGQAESKLNEASNQVKEKKYAQAQTSLKDFYGLLSAAELAANKAKNEEAISLKAKEEAMRLKAKEEVKPREKEYSVIEGDCLWNIAGREYNDPYKWQAIYNANKELIKDPHWIYVDQVFIIPLVD